jgi:hypothetical protein
MLGRAGSAWSRFWFAPRGPLDLCAGRAAFFALVALLYLPRDAPAWGAVDPVFWAPVDLFDIARLPLLAPSALATLEVAWGAALLLACLGLGTRIATVVAFILGFYLLGVPQSMGKIHHFDGIVVVTMGILAVSRCGDAFSLDAWLRRKRADAPRVAPSPEYAWPVRLIQVALALLFFAAGLAKLRYGGLDWILSDQLRWVLLRSWHHGASTDPWTDLAPWLVRYDFVVHGLAAATVAIELAYPLALTGRRAAAVAVPLALLLLLGIRLVQGPPFGTLIACHVFWIPWERLAAIPSRMPFPARPT